MSEIELLVKEADKADVGKGIARIAKSSMEQLKVSEGEPVEIVGKRNAVEIVMQSAKGDKEKDIIHLDGFTRKNAGLTVNQKAIVRRPTVENATKMILAPVDVRLNVDDDFIHFVTQRRLIGNYFYEDSTIIVMMLGHAIPFKVARTFPHAIPVKVVEKTQVLILNDPLPEYTHTTTLNIKYLLRLEWLRHLASRINATSNTFSIADVIIDEDEQKVLQAAKKIADENLSTVRVDLNLKSNNTNLGTIPWIEVDTYGNMASLYPEVQIPAPLSSIATQSIGRHISSMRRCFKTGVKECPKVVNFSPRTVVVAMPFEAEFTDVYKYAIRPTLEEAGFKPWKADEQISNIDIMCKICHAIQESGYLLANITMWNPNVVFELGLAYGLGRNVILVKHEKSDVPVDLKGIEYIGYNTIDELRRNLALFLKGTTQESA